MAPGCSGRITLWKTPDARAPARRRAVPEEELTARGIRDGFRRSTSPSSPSTPSPSSSWRSGYRARSGTHKKDAQDYFLASRALPWWAIGTSLIAANISAEQIIGMSGSGYVIGLGIASYEWMAALTLIIVGKYFLPIFLKNGIYTMPEFLREALQPRPSARSWRSSGWASTSSSI